MVVFLIGYVLECTLNLRTKLKIIIKNNNLLEMFFGE